MSSADPTSQDADQPPSQPTAQPTPPPASPNADQQYASSVRVPRRLVRRSDDRLLTVPVTVLGLSSVIIAYLVAWVIVSKDAVNSAVSTPASQPPG